MNNYILVEVIGKHVNNYLKWLLSKKIPIINLDIINYNELHLIIDYKYYNLLKKYSKTYKINIIKKYGKLRLLEIIRNNAIIIACLMPAIILLYALSHTVFSVDIMSNKKEIVDMLTKELSKYDIKKFHLKKDYHYLEKVKDNILHDNKDTLEWIEIEENGTKYIVRLVERKKSKITSEYKYQSVVASKNATIVNITAYSGEKTKQLNEYVRRGDVIISGQLTKPDGTNIYTKAKGMVTAEVWYKVNVEYPLYYQEEKLTGQSKNVISMYFIKKELPIFPYKRYKQFRKQSNILIENNYIPFKIAKEKLYEVNIKEDIYTNEEAVEKAILEAKKKLQTQNNKIIEIKKVITLSKENLNSKVKLVLFVSTIEDITEIIEIKPELTLEKVEN